LSFDPPRQPEVLVEQMARPDLEQLISASGQRRTSSVSVDSRQYPGCTSRLCRVVAGLEQDVPAMQRSQWGLALLFFVALAASK
jgi:hypothetical protein